VCKVLVVGEFVRLLASFWLIKRGIWVPVSGIGDGELRILFDEKYEV